jgi:uncharacterized protein (DUF1330 family)
MDFITCSAYGPRMPAYAIANLSNVDFNADIVRYLQEIDDTLTPFGGRFLVHGTTPEVIEGPWADATVIIEFPHVEAARAWYASPAYLELLPLRTENSDSTAAILDGVGPGYRAASFLEPKGV